MSLNKTATVCSVQTHTHTQNTACAESRRWKRHTRALAENKWQKIHKFVGCAAQNAENNLSSPVVLPANGLSQNCIYGESLHTVSPFVYGRRLRAHCSSSSCTQSLLTLEINRCLPLVRCTRVTQTQSPRKKAHKLIDNNKFHFTDVWMFTPLPASLSLSHCLSLTGISNNSNEFF